MSESIYKKTCVRVMRDRYGAQVAYIHGNAMQEPGLADVTVWTALPFQWHGELEFKGHATKIRPVQFDKAAKNNKRVPCTYLFIKENYVNPALQDAEQTGTLVLYDSSACPVHQILIEKHDVLLAVGKMLERCEISLIQGAECRAWLAGRGALKIVVQNAAQNAVENADKKSVEIIGTKNVG